MSQRKLFNITLAMMSLLNGYAFSFFRGFSLAMIISSCFAVVAICTVLREQLLIVKSGLILFCIFAVIESFVASFMVPFIDYRRMIYITLKLFVWAIYVTVAGSLYFDYSLLLKYTKNIIIVTFIYLCIQYAAHYVLHISLPVSFNLGIIRANSEDYEYIMEAGNNVFRPGSFWTEPGYLGYYYNGFLAMCIFDQESVKEVTKHFSTIMLITCLGVLLSMSSGAMGTMAILFLLSAVIKNRKNIITALFAGIVIVILGVCFIKFNWIESLKGINASFDNTIWKLQNMDKVGRVGASFELFELLSPRNAIWGLGLGNEMFITRGRYMNGIVTLVMWIGYIGLFFWVALFFRMGRCYCATIVQKVMLYILLFNGVFAGLYFGAHSFIYLIVAFYKDFDSNVMIGEIYESTYIRA